MDGKEKAGAQSANRAYKGSNVRRKHHLKVPLTDHKLHLFLFNLNPSQNKANTQVQEKDQQSFATSGLLREQRHSVTRCCCRAQTFSALCCNCKVVKMGKKMRVMDFMAVLHQPSISQQIQLGFKWPREGRLAENIINDSMEIIFIYFFMQSQNRKVGVGWKLINTVF